MGVYTFLLAVLFIKCFATGDIGARVSKYAFPKDFKFGIATSAIQVEGGWNQSDKSENMWDRYVHTHPQNVADGSNHDVSADSYHLYKDDVQLVRNMGLDVYRFSISWTRILPTGMDDKISKDGVAYYNNLINELLKYNITPMVTIYHWELPQVLQEFGGWTNPLIVNYFEDYARVVFKLFGDRVKFWLSINEPHQTCHFGYGHVVLVPRYDSTGVGEYLCAHYNLLAHARVYHLYDTEFRPTQKGIIGVTMDTFYGEPRTNSSQDRDAAEMYNQMHFGLYCRPIFSKKGDYPEIVRRAIDEKSALQGLSRSRLPSFTAEEVAYIRGTFDFLGLNHYTTVLIQGGTQPPGAEPSRPFDMGVYEYRDPAWKMSQSSWHRVFPEGFRKILNWIKREYGDIPIVVTENGVSDLPVLEDYDRVEYFNLYLEQLLLALHEDKINVTTYIAWSLMDSFEWLSGYSESFGLHQVDFKSPHKTRTPRLSAHNLKEIVKSRIIDFDKFAAKKI